METRVAVVGAMVNGLSNPRESEGEYSMSKTETENSSVDSLFIAR